VAIREFCISNGTVMPEVVARTVDSLSEQFRRVRHGNLFLCHYLKRKIGNNAFQIFMQ
jgi:hypothetical protein